MLKSVDKTLSKGSQAISEHRLGSTEVMQHCHRSAILHTLPMRCGKADDCWYSGNEHHAARRNCGCNWRDIRSLCQGSDTSVLDCGLSGRHRRYRLVTNDGSRSLRDQEYRWALFAMTRSEDSGLKRPAFCNRTSSQPSASLLSDSRLSSG